MFTFWSSFAEDVACILFQRGAAIAAAEQCAAPRARLVPRMAEYTGAWDPSAAAVHKRIAFANAEPEAMHAALLQELCIVTRQFRARAALRRRSEQGAEVPPGRLEAAALLAADAT